MDTRYRAKIIFSDISSYIQDQLVVPRSVILHGDKPDFGLLIGMPFGPGQMVYDVECWYFTSDRAPEYESYISHDFVSGVTVLDGYLEPSRCCFFLEDYKVPDGSGPYVVIQEFFN